jgi:LacI family transcriptional regulator
MMAVNLRKSRSNLIALIIPEVTMFFFPSVIQGIEEVVHEMGYQLLVLQSQNTLKREKQNLQLCHDHAIDGILISLSAETTDLSHLEELQEIGIPIVLFDKSTDQKEFDQVIIDDYDAAYKCVDLLLSKGVKHVCGVFGNPQMSITKQRIKGFEQAIADRAAYVTSEIIYANNQIDCYASCKIFLKNSQPDGFFCMSDELVAGLYPALYEAKISIPKDCKVISISDGYLPHILQPTLTHFHHNGSEIGKLSAQRLIQKITGKIPSDSVDTIEWAGFIQNMSSTEMN